MLTFTHIFERCGPTEMARRIGDVDPNTAHGWKRVGSIPGHYWRDIADAGIATLAELAEAAANRGRAAADRRSAA